MHLKIIFYEIMFHNIANIICLSKINQANSII